MNTQMNATVLRRTILSAARLLCLSAPGTPHAERNIAFDHVFDLGTPGGQTFLQDQDGFLWIGSDGGGMFGYDGYELKNYGVGPFRKCPENLTTHWTNSEHIRLTYLHTKSCLFNRTE